MTLSLLSLVKKLGIEHPASPWQKKTVSLGVAAMLPLDTLAKEKLVNNSDKAFYLAKSSGRNCYRLYS